MRSRLEESEVTLSIRDGYSRNVARALATYLDTHLPRVQSDWWQNLVIYSLSPTQQGFVHERLQAGQPRSCGILDLAGLEKVLRRNQSELRFRANLPDGVVTRNDMWLIFVIIIRTKARTMTRHPQPTLTERLT